jgi:epoxyqueuosine reductase QueG
MTIELEFASILKSHGADFVSFTDISKLSEEQNRGFPYAIIFGIVLSPSYIRKLGTRKLISEDEFHATESKTDQLADYMADLIARKGYSAYSQSEYNLTSTGSYREEIKTTPLPHKTIAGLAGLGWIGKHNLLVNSEYGSAISLCSVLTDAPLKTVLHRPASSQCGDCTICRDICQVQAISGTSWNPDVPRDEIVNVYSCNSCLMCLALCPWTQEYANRAYE